MSSLSGSPTVYQFPTKKKIPVGIAVAFYGSTDYVVPAKSNSSIIGVVVSVDNTNNTVQVMNQGVFTTSTAQATSGAVWTTTGEEPKRKKQILKCSECKKKITEYYSPYLQEEAMCKTCHQIDKLIE